MRGPGDISTALVSAALAVALGLTAACTTTTVDVAFDEGHDFSGYRTWSWLSRAASLEAAPDEERALDRLTSRLVQGELRSRGLVQVREGSDLLVSYALFVRREHITVSETGAENILFSHHSSPSYGVQATTTRVDRYDTATLQIVVAERRRNTVVWRGELSTRQQGEFGSHLPESVARLLGEFPAIDATTAPTRAPRLPETDSPEPPGRERETAVAPEAPPKAGHPPA